MLLGHLCQTQTDLLQAHELNQCWRQQEHLYIFITLISSNHDLLALKVSINNDLGVYSFLKPLLRHNSVHRTSPQF